MQTDYEATDNLAQPDQQPIFSFSSLQNPQMQNIFDLSHHHYQLLVQNEKLPQSIINSRFGPTVTTSTQFLQPCEFRGREAQEATAESLENKYLGLNYGDNDESSSFFTHHEVGLQQKSMPNISLQSDHQEYSTAVQASWNFKGDHIRLAKTVLERKQKSMKLYGELEGLHMNNAGETSSALSSEPNHRDVLKKKKKKKRKRTAKAILRCTTRFVESLAKSVVAHQDRLHSSFLEASERIERERSEREDVRRLNEARARDREAVARVREQARASEREALIVSYLEKITGQRVGRSIGRY